MSAITRDAQHNYYYGGKQYRGVTSTLGVIDKSGPLMHWAAKNTAEAAVEMATSGYMESAGSALLQLIATVGPEGAVKALSSRSNWKRDEAAALGTEVHHLADLVVRGQPTPPMGETTRGRVLAYSDWWKSSGWTLRTSEAMVVNTLDLYGGTIDLLARDRDGRTVLADIKTGRAIYKEAVLQLTAYGNAELIQPPAEFMGLIDEVQAFKMPHVDRYVVLHVTADRVREVEISVGTMERLAWAACLDLATWVDTMKGKSL